MSANRRVLVAVAMSLAIAGSAHAIVVCRTPDGATYATDRPPPDCAPIPSSEIEKFPPYSASQEESAPAPSNDDSARTPEWLRERQAPQAEAMPPPAARDEPIRREDEGPESRRTHAIASCEQTVAEQLERPSTARWPNRSDYRVKETGGRYSIEGQVEAEEALGSSQIKWRCDAVFSGERWIAVAELQKEAPPPAAPPIAAAAPAPPVRASERERSTVRETTAMPPPPPEVPMAPPPAPPPSMPATTAPLPSEPLPSTPPAVVSAPQEAPVSERWKERSSCPGMKFDASTVKYKNEGYQVVSGEITYSGTRPVRDVRVCASGVCQAVGGAGVAMTPGTPQKFSVKTPTLDTPVVTAQCSVMIEGPGL